ncbi:unnamed protein product [Rotaria sp. Silwood2]|nr:unnamed protein product [Rotaria sp. Silwood2]CAF4183922.1 unnamed protein product [Rotaria sp. Silwood2]
MTAPTTITFQVSNNIEACTTRYVPSRDFSSTDLDRWSNKSNRKIKEILSFENGQTNYPMIKDLNHRVKNAFVATVFKAYCDHYPLELSVEDFWVVIAQGVSIHLNKNSEKFRHLLVEHEGKKTLTLIVDHLRIPESDRPANANQSIPAINWPLAVREMCELIKKDMKADLTTLMSKRFSSTTDVEGAVFDCTLMDIVKSYYSYGFGLTCGIPQVTLRGTPDDFQELIDRVQQLKIFFTDFHWWFDTLLPHLKKLKQSAEGKDDIDWWQKICHRNNNMSGIDLLMGWLADFIPYKSDKNGGYCEARRKILMSEQKIDSGIDFGDLEESVTQTDFVLNDNGYETKMKLIAGFLGISQNPETGALRPCLGWVTALPSEETVPQNCIITLKDNTSASEILRIKEKIIKEGGSITNELTMLQMLVVAIFDCSIEWLEKDEHIKGISKDY